MALDFSRVLFTVDLGLCCVQLSLLMAPLCPEGLEGSLQVVAGGN